MGKRILFTKLNVGTADGLESRALMEKQLAEHFMHTGAGGSASFKISGFGFSIVASQLAVDIALGVGIINGRRVETTSTYRLSGLAARYTTNYIFAYYAVDGSGNVTGTIEFSVQTTPTGGGANSLLLGRCTTDADDVTSFDETKIFTMPIVATYTGTGTASRTIFLG